MDGGRRGLASRCSQNDSHLPIDGWTLTQVLISSIGARRLGLQSIFTLNGRSIPHSLQSPTGLIFEGLRSWFTLHLQPPASFVLRYILPRYNLAPQTIVRQSNTVELWVGSPIDLGSSLRSAANFVNLEKSLHPSNFNFLMYVMGVKFLAVHGLCEDPNYI